MLSNLWRHERRALHAERPGDRCWHREATGHPQHRLQAWRLAAAPGARGIALIPAAHAWSAKVVLSISGGDCRRTARFSGRVRGTSMPPIVGYNHY